MVVVAGAPSTVMSAPPSPPRRRYVPTNADVFISSSVLFWFLTLPSLIRLGFGVFNCRYVGMSDLGKSQYFFLDLQEKCGSARHLVFGLGVGVPMLLLNAVIVPSAIMLRLRQVGNARLNDASLMLRWGLLHSGYREQRYWWELVVLLRKYLVIVASTFIASDTGQLQLLLFVFIVSLHLHGVERPYGREDPGQQLLHRHEMVSLLLLTLMLWCGLYFATSPRACESTQKGWCGFLGVAVLLLNVGFLIMVMGTCCSEWTKRANFTPKIMHGLMMDRISGLTSRGVLGNSETSSREAHSHSTSAADLDSIEIEMTENPLDEAKSSGNKSL